jgi:hypothetical protein
MLAKPSSAAAALARQSEKLMLSPVFFNGGHATASLPEASGALLPTRIINYKEDCSAVG